MHNTKYLNLNKVSVIKLRIAILNKSTTLKINNNLAHYNAATQEQLSKTLVLKKFLL